MSVRWVCRLALVAAVTASAVVAQPGGPPDRVYYRERGEDGKWSAPKFTDGPTKESAGGVEVAVGGKARVIPPTDLIRVEYGTLPGLTNADRAPLTAFEDGKEPAKSAAAFGESRKKAGAGANPRTKKYLAFREAMWTAKAADATTGDAFAAEAPRSVAALTDFARQYKGTWEAWPALRTAARQLTELGQHAEAAKLLGELANTPGLPRDLKHDAKLAEATALLRADKSLEAQGVIAELEKDGEFPASGGPRERLGMLKLAAGAPKASGDGKPDAVLQLESAVGAAKSPLARAAGFNLLGDALVAAKLPRDALWAYLWVDVVFTADKDEQAYAAGKLAGLFAALGDAERAAQYEEKRPRVR